ncbi:MAG: leucine-rich repeat protein [Clostridia bacterium]|nr:leucine-rich repeat protein [Clostridia bacterium]
MKKILACLLALAMLLASCGDGNGDTVTTDPDSHTHTPSTDHDPEVDTTNYRARVEELFADVTTTPQSEFQYEVANGGITLLSYTGNRTEVRVPDKIGLLSVKKIADGAFKNNQTLKTLILPDTLTELGVGILEGCNALTALHTPMISATADGTQSLGYLFNTVNGRIPVSLAYVSLGNAAETVSARAFAECGRLVAVILDQRITSVGDFAFHGCDYLKYVNMERLSTVGDYAFAACKVLVRADLTERTVSIGLGAFQGCAALSSMTLPFVGRTQTEKTYLGYLFGAEAPDFTAGFIPAYLRTVKLLDTCTALGNYAFYECSSLQTVTLPKNLQVIGVRAFEKCTALTAIMLPNSVNAIRENAFFGCTALKTVTLGTGLSVIGINAFYGCTALKAIELPASLSALSASAFAGCTALESVALGGVTTVGKNAFYGCEAIKNVTTANVVVLAEGNVPVQKILYPEE